MQAFMVFLQMHLNKLVFKPLKATKESLEKKIEEQTRTEKTQERLKCILILWSTCL